MLWVTSKLSGPQILSLHTWIISQSPLNSKYIKMGVFLAFSWELLVKHTAKIFFNILYFLYSYLFNILILFHSLTLTCLECIEHEEIRACQSFFLCSRLNLLSVSNVIRHQCSWPTLHFSYVVTTKPKEISESLYLSIYLTTITSKVSRHAY